MPVIVSVPLRISSLGVVNNEFSLRPSMLKAKQAFAVEQNRRSITTLDK
jgi:hypothetical protein